MRKLNGMVKLLKMSIEDELFLVVYASVSGGEIKTLIDSGAIGYFVSPACDIACGPKSVPRGVLL